MILDNFKLKNKVAVVTGCSTGLGQAMTIGLADAGADIVGIDYVDAPETAEFVKDRGRKYLGIKADLLSIDPIEGIITQVVKEFGHIDILVPRFSTYGTKYC